MAILVCQNWQTGAPLAAKLDLPLDILLHQYRQMKAEIFILGILYDTGEYWTILDNIGHYWTILG